MRAVAVLGLVAALLLRQGAANAQLQNFIDVCGDQNAEPRDVVYFCQRALDTGKLDPTAQAQVRANLGVGYFELGQYQAAVDTYTRALQDAPGMTALYLNRARAFEKLRRLGEAVRDYELALNIEPNSADIFLGRGVLLLSHGDPERAIIDFTKAIQLKPDWTATHFNRGVAYHRTGDYPSAERDFSAVINRNPRDAVAYLNRGRARAAMDRADAGSDFDRALDLDPEWGGGWFARGRYYDENGNREAANRDFLRAYELGYPDPWLIERVREISG